MTQKKVFLSHIHEEKELALLIQEALEEEFGGFVKVFVSSDGQSIPAGSNFLRRIEDGLLSCVAAIFLISKKSVSRNWINFELGAVWIRNAISLKGGGPEILTVPMCHSGMVPNTLPAPLNNLNAILAGQSSHLEMAFKGIQEMAGGGGRLKTDFDKLAEKITYFENSYSFGVKIGEILKELGAGKEWIHGLFQNIDMKLEMQIFPFDNVRSANFRKAEEIAGEIDKNYAVLRKLKSSLVHNGFEQFSTASGVFEVRTDLLAKSKDCVFRYFGIS